jgi:hypothetical protein
MLDPRPQTGAVPMAQPNLGANSLANLGNNFVGMRAASAMMPNENLARYEEII